MLYLGIDQHARQVSTKPEMINTFFQQLTRERLQDGDEFFAIVEVCGFNDWLIRMVPLKGFRVVDLHLIPLSQALLGAMSATECV